MLFIHDLIQIATKIAIKGASKWCKDRDAATVQASHFEYDFERGHFTVHLLFEGSSDPRECVGLFVHEVNPGEYHIEFTSNRASDTAVLLEEDYEMLITHVIKPKITPDYMYMLVTVLQSRLHNAAKATVDEYIKSVGVNNVGKRTVRNFNSHAIRVEKLREEMRLGKVDDDTLPF